MARPEIIVSTKDIADFFGVSSKQMSEWRKAGCPQVKRGRWNLKEVFDWWWENMASDRAAQQGGDESMNEAKRIYWWEKAKKEQFQNEQLAENLIPRETIESEWAKRAAEYKAGCFELENSLPPPPATRHRYTSLQQLPHVRTGLIWTRLWTYKRC